MFSRFRSTAVAVAGTVATALLVLAAPAAASAAENGDIYAISWDGIVGSVDPTTGAFTALGPSTGISFTGFDVHPTTGIAYAVSYDETCGIYEIDLTTGTATLIAPLTDEGVEVLDCTVLDIDDNGIARVGYDAPGGTNLGLVDLTTGVFTSIRDGAPRLSGLATDPTSGILYAITYGNEVYAIDPSTGDGLFVSYVTNNSVYAADFDRGGLLWGTDWDNLISLSTADWIATQVGPLVEGEENRSGEALTVYYVAPVVAPAGVPVLAATGVDVSAVGAGALALLMAGGAVLAQRSRRATA